MFYSDDYINNSIIWRSKLFIRHVKCYVILEHVLGAFSGLYILINRGGVLLYYITFYFNRKFKMKYNIGKKSCFSIRCL